MQIAVTSACERESVIRSKRALVERQCACV